MKNLLITLAVVLLLLIVGLVTGCVVIGKVETMNNKGMLFTTRSAQDSEDCVSGISGGGTTTADIPLK